MSETLIGDDYEVERVDSELVEALTDPAVLATAPDWPRPIRREPVLADLFALPDAELVFGLGSSRRHAVTHREALAAIGNGPVRGSKGFAVCGEIVRIAAKWGAYERDSEYLPGDRACAQCAWIVAAGRDEIAVQIEAAVPLPEEQEVTCEQLGDGLLGVKLLKAIADDRSLADVKGDFVRSSRVDLLALSAAHLPELVVCEQCLEVGNAHQGQRCPATLVACMACTATAGPWAGEWESSILTQCTVAAPCSVLSALCAHYNIPITSGGGPRGKTAKRRNGRGQ